MAQPNTTQEDINYEERLGPAHVGLRDDLEVHRHLLHHKVHYVFRDPLSLQCYQFSLKEYTILTHLTPRKSLAEIVSTLIENGIISEDEKDEIYQFVLSLHQQNILQLPISDDKMLYRRYIHRKLAKKKQQLMSAFFLQIPLINPDVFLDKTVHLVKPLFTKWFFMTWLTGMMIAVMIVAGKYDEMVVSAGRLFALKNLMALWVILILLKGIHEFGHAYACKIFGGEVTEMGIYLIAMTPCAYVDVTSSWGFSQKAKRLIVGFGGMYFESIIAMIALFTWVAAESVSVRIMAYNIMFAASVMTVLMNINPLMRFDGYYILSDLVEIPNLREVSRQTIIQGLKRLLLGIKVDRNDYGLVQKCIFVLFGICASLYKITIVVSISMVIAGKAFLIGIIMASFYLGSIILSTLTRLVWYLWKSPETAGIKVRATVISVLFVVAVPTAVMVCPLPQSIKADVQLVKENQHVIFATQDGFIEQVHYDPHDPVDPATTLMTLTNPVLEDYFLTAENDYRKALIEFEALQAAGSSHVTDIKKQKERTKNLKEKLNQQKLEIERLHVRSSNGGQLVECMEKDSVGRFIHKGDAIGTIVEGKWQAKAMLAQSDISALQPLSGKKTRVRWAAQPGVVLEGVIEKVSPTPITQVTLPILTSLGEGRIPVDPVTNKTYEPYYEVTIVFDDLANDNFRYGMTGKMKLKGQRQPLGLTLWRRALHFLNRLDISVG
ncbi:MAG: HlyD family efflux transporter periplasmic adaptor subunit [Phycisphaerae bacterium]|nr:HlyD family efflux transporter periplasmic adaptor subunit [Phycisphaerae bacterium]